MMFLLIILNTVFAKGKTSPRNQRW